MKDDQARGLASPAQADPGEEVFRELLGRPLERMERAFEPEVPQAAWFEGLVRQRQRELRRKNVRDLALLWIVGCAVLGGMALLASESVTGFVLLQACAAAGGAAVLFGGGALKRVRRLWMK